MTVPKNTTWLILFPQTPAQPSSLRVLVWRRLQQAGAINLQSGAWMLPQNSEQEQALLTLIAELEQQGGSGFMLEAKAPTEAVQEDLIERFRQERAKEYQEVRERSQDFLAEIEKETQARKFTFAELEENEQDLLKLTRWLRKIQRRDFFPTQTSQEATETLARCRQALQTFTTTVYEQAGLPPGSTLEEAASEAEEQE